MLALERVLLWRAVYGGTALEALECGSQVLAVGAGRGKGPLVSATLSLPSCIVGDGAPRGARLMRDGVTHSPIGDAAGERGERDVRACAMRGGVVFISRPGLPGESRRDARLNAGG
ncbi:hypothetical protein B0H19DRAFT_1254071 [Mycena capillaripes]|nr:hypothetical protein B0H19DRAFT_1254071 [Mycena capillaripes]